MTRKVENVIMLYGNPLSGKSTAAGKIRGHLAQKGLKAKIISSAKLRLKGKRHSGTVAFIDEENERTKRAKDSAYRQMCLQAEKCLGKGVIPILDASFHKHYRREQVYGMALRHRAETFVVWTVLDDEKMVRKHIKARATAQKPSMLHTWAQYTTMARQADRLEDYELAKKPSQVGWPSRIIRFDRKTRKVRLYNCAGKSFAKEIVKSVTS